MIPQTPWTERKFEFNFPVGLFPVIVERLRGTPVRLSEMLENVSDATLTKKIGDRWSIIEQVNHLYNSEEIWYGRIEDLLSRQEMFQRRTLKTTLLTEDIQILLQKFSDARNKLIVTIENMDEPTASLSIIHPRLQTPIRLVDSLFATAEHDDHHLAKIRELLVS